MGGHDWTKRFPWIVEAALKNRQTQFVIDDEAINLGVDGNSDFDVLHFGSHNGEVQLCAFDVLCYRRPARCAKPTWGGYSWQTGRDLQQPIRDRCRRARPIPRRLPHGIGRLGFEV